MSETARATGSESPLSLHRSVPEIQSCQQLIVVTTRNWSDVNASVQLLERAPGENAPWRKAGKQFPAVIGKQGLGWGIGLHGNGENGTPIKREGDQRSPAGIFRLFKLFGTASPGQVRFLRFPYQQVLPSTEAVDDPGSRYYNRIVDRSEIKDPDWKTSESMLAVGGRYRFGVMLEHNWSQVPGFGSCIFFHVWNPDGTGTAGCTAASLANIERLLYWLDADKNPLIVQLPSSEYLRLRRSWRMP
jgi:D-alanyl-D-alanine dipeptidase